MLIVTVPLGICSSGRHDLKILVRVHPTASVSNPDLHRGNFLRLGHVEKEPQHANRTNMPTCAMLEIEQWHFRFEHMGHLFDPSTFSNVIQQNH